jgi:hypothetical protein
LVHPAKLGFVAAFDIEVIEEQAPAKGCARLCSSGSFCEAVVTKSVERVSPPKAQEVG